MATTAGAKPALERRGGYLIHPSSFVDSSFAPVYVLNFEGTLVESSTAPMEAHIAAAERFYGALDHPYASVTILSQLRELKPTVRKLYAEHVNAIEPIARRLCRGRAVVCSNALQRGFVTAVQWFLRTDIDNSVFTSVQDAVAWARGQVR